METLANQVLMGPRNYMQGKGVLHQAGQYLASLGHNIFVIADETVWTFVQKPFEALCQSAKLEMQHATFLRESVRTRKLTV